MEVKSRTVRLLTAKPFEHVPVILQADEIENAKSFPIQIPTGLDSEKSVGPILPEARIARVVPIKELPPSKVLSAIIRRLGKHRTQVAQDQQNRQGLC